MSQWGVQRRNPEEDKLRYSPGVVRRDTLSLSSGASHSYGPPSISHSPSPGGLHQVEEPEKESGKYEEKIGHLLTSRVRNMSKHQSIMEEGGKEAELELLYQPEISSEAVLPRITRLEVWDPSTDLTRLELAVFEDVSSCTGLIERRLAKEMCLPAREEVSRCTARTWTMGIQAGSSQSARSCWPPNRREGMVGLLIGSESLHLHQTRTEDPPL